MNTVPLLAKVVPSIENGFVYNRVFINALPETPENFRGKPTSTGIFWNVHEWRLR